MKTWVILFASLLGFKSFGQQATEGTTFAVDDVKITSEPLPTNDIKLILQNQLNQPVFALPEEHAEKRIAPSHMNAFVYSIHSAFDDHRPLELSPDDVWLTICQAFGNHIAMHGDALGDKLLTDNRPETITVFIEDLAQNNAEGWEQLVQGFNDSLALYVQGTAVELVNPEFSTTTPVMTTAYQITLMDAMKNYFGYRGESGCGIPSITLTGTPEDWEQIYNNIDQFNAYGMEFWTTELKPVLKEFVLASQGTPTIEFWQAIYKHEAFYGTVATSGWILKFFPYLKGTRDLEPDVWDREPLQQKYYYPNPYIFGDKYLLSDISTYDLPKGYVNVPFVWAETDPETGNTTEHELELSAGFLGVEQDGITVKPLISWCITDPKGVEPKYAYWDRHPEEDSTITHAENYWVPGVSKKAVVAPIFDPENNADAAAGLDAFQKLLRDNGFDGQGNATLEFIVAWDGSTIFTNVSGSLKAKEVELRTFISLLETEWKPGRNFLRGHDPTKDKKPSPCNLSMSIQL